MLPLKYHTISPLLYEKTRLSALSSNIPYGSTDLHNEHIIQRMNGIVEVLGGYDVHNNYEMIRTREPPDLYRERSHNRKSYSDILLKDTFRQYNGMEERYRRGLPRIEDLRNISDPATKYHRTISRGYERYLVDYINRLDGEGLDRRSIRPVISATHG